MNAEELHIALKIETPFKDWAEAQIKAGKPFKPFYGKLADGKLGKNYTLPPELEAELVAAREIQSGLLPKGPPELPGFDVAGVWYPATFAAGDSNVGGTNEVPIDAFQTAP